MKPSDEKYAYFQPGEMLFLLSHDDDQRIDVQLNHDEGYRSLNAQNNDENSPSPFDRIIDEWINDIQEVAKRHNDKLTISRRKERELHFPGTSKLLEPRKLDRTIPQGSKYQSPKPERRGAFSLIPATVSISEQHRNDRNREGYVDATELAQLIASSDKMRDELEKKIGEKREELEKKMGRPQAKRRSPIKVEAVLPNWLSSSCSEYGGGGGPGSIPEPYRGMTENVPFNFNFKLPAPESVLRPEGNRGKGVTVAILDTAPTPHALAEAYEKYHKLDPRNQTEHHPLIESLLRPSGRLHLHPASLDDLLRMRAVHLRDHNYEMSDHGLFVAGIIHTIAPEAEIHLYEVLNPYGVGDILSIAQGLWNVFNRFSGQPLVINCSFMLNIPLLGQPITDLYPEIVALFGDNLEDHRDSGYLTLERFEQGKDWLARQGQLIEWICDLIYQHGSRVIAAAGNDWRFEENKDRPQARFPAAFESVWGVGALPKDAQPDTKGKYPVSHYSNRSDKPEEVGVATLGGEPGQDNGVLGVYLGRFPSMEFRLRQYPAILRPFLRLIFAIGWGSFAGPKNRNNWAWWAGTSFATPIITGIIASVLSDLDQPATTEDAIGQSYDPTRGIIKQALTVQEEDGMEAVRQVEASIGQFIL